MAKKHHNDIEENFEAIKTSLSSAEAFIEKHRIKLLIGVGVVVLAALMIFGIQKFYIEPRNERAEAAMFEAVSAYEAGNFEFAVKGDGNVMGLLSVIDEYGSTPAGNLAQLYVGLSYLHLAKYKDAVTYLKKFDTKEKIMKSVSLGALGDAYSEMDKLDKALACYKDAADLKITMTSPRFLTKAALIYESQTKWEKAIKMYEEIKYSYPASAEARDADKNIERAQLLQKE